MNAEATDSGAVPDAEPDLPSGWRRVRLKDVTVEGTERNRDGEFDRTDVLGVDNQDGLGPSDRLLGDDFSRYKLVRRHQFAYNPMRLNVGSIGLWANDQTAIVSPDYIVFGCREDQLDPDFMDLFRRSAAWNAQIRQSGQGSVRIRYYYRHIGEFTVPLPPLGEQRAIAGVLRRLQRAVETTEGVLNEARQFKRSLMQHFFTYGLVPFKSADKIPLTETDFGSYPANWKALPLRECAEVQTGVAKGRSLESSEVVTVPYLRVANVQDGYLDLKEMKTIEIRRSEVGRYALQDGDVLLTEGGDFDKLGRGHVWGGQVKGCVHQNHVFAVRSNRELLQPEFLAYLTQSGYGKAYFVSVAHKTTNLACINTTKLKAFPTLLPSIREQEEIVAALKQVDRKIWAEEDRRTSLAAIFGTLLHQLMTGQVRVPDAAPEIV